MPSDPTTWRHVLAWSLLVLAGLAVLWGGFSG